MPQHAGGLGFVEEQLAVALRVLVVIVRPRVRDLDRDRPVDEWILRQVDTGHVPGADFAHDAILAEMSAFKVGCCLRLHCALETPEKRTLAGRRSRCLPPLSDGRTVASLASMRNTQRR